MGRSAIKRATKAVPKKEPMSSSKRPAPHSRDSNPHHPPYHTFTSEETLTLRKKLLIWYDRCKRDLPWRRLAITESDLDRRAYAVWVSEVMLQQTQVSTVIDYYTKWMKTWPTVQDLATASLEDPACGALTVCQNLCIHSAISLAPAEVVTQLSQVLKEKDIPSRTLGKLGEFTDDTQEVNEQWSGLGYYSRGRRLHEGAQKVVQVLGGRMPRTAEDLQKLLPGVGRYTAGAVASISYGQVTGVVDGNVIRVLCRLRRIGADFTSPTVTDTLWSLADNLVDPDRAGDFNQAMMELGATVCTPKKALCGECPLQSLCQAYKKVELDSAASLSKLVSTRTDTPNTSISDIEECAAAASCPLCIPSSDQWDRSLGVANYPRKAAKKPSREEQTVTCVWERPGERGDAEYLLLQRPQKGLLAGMWEFPSMILEKTPTKKERQDILCSRLQEVTGCEVTVTDLQFVGEVIHIFSHINQTYQVYFLHSHSMKEEEAERTALRWVTKRQFMESAVPTAMKKILGLCEGRGFVAGAGVSSKKRKRDRRDIRPPVETVSKQRSIQSFFRAAATVQK